MRHSHCKRIILSLLIVVSSFYAEAQVTACPSNLDFEDGNLTGWECKTGRVAYLGVNTLTWTGFTPDPSSHEMIDGNLGLVDFYGQFPQNCPNGSRYSVKLGNTSGGARAEAISYRYTIPASVSVFSIFFNYAVVLQDPSHSVEEQPRFRARIFNVTDNIAIDCVNFDFTASGSLPGFQSSPQDASVLFKGWTPVTLNLTGYAGKTIELEFITSDCTRNGHFGYAYVDVNSNCNGAIQGNSICPGDVGITLTAPFGFEYYTWYSDNSFSTILSSSQTLLLNPLPAVGTVYPVVVTPYPGFGCQDTVYATIQLAQYPTADAGNDKTVCSNKQAQLGGVTPPHLDYSWSPAGLLSNPLAAKPFTLPGLLAPTTFYLTVTDSVTGCNLTDTDEVIISPEVVDTVSLVTGNTQYCKGSPVNISLWASAPGGIQWHENGIPIPGATSNFYFPEPSVTSIYWATILKGGCLDTTRNVLVSISPIPVPRIELDNAIQCLNIPVELKNKSSIISDESLSYLWKISDGSSYTSTDLDKIFPIGGKYDIMLKATSPMGCADSVSKSITVIETCNVYMPTGFTPNNDGKNDVLKPILYGVKKLHRFVVFDRWGTIVYSTKNINEGWDGTFKGLPLTSSVFVWMLEYDTYDHKNLILKGTVTVIK